MPMIFVRVSFYNNDEAIPFLSRCKVRPSSEAELFMSQT